MAIHFKRKCRRNKRQGRPVLCVCRTAKPSTAVRNLKIFRCNSAFKAISKGDKGSEVTKLQKFLKWAGFDCGTADGDFGEKTFGATKSFQLKYGLTADGEVGSKTIAKAKEVKL